MPSRSPILQLLRTINDWTEEQDNGIEDDNVDIDFQTDFDKVLHQILLETKTK